MTSIEGGFKRFGLLKVVENLPLVNVRLGVRTAKLELPSAS